MPAEASAPLLSAAAPTTGAARLDLAPARWIWLPSQRTLANTVVRFRRHLQLGGQPLTARGWILADSRYRLFVNGQRVQWGPAPADPRWPEADPLALEAFLRVGDNLLAVEVLFFGSGDGTWPAGKPGLLLRLDLHCSDGTRRTLVSDGDWECALDHAHRPGGHRRWYLRALQEECDLRLADPHWLIGGVGTRARQGPSPDRDGWLPAMELQGAPQRPSIATRYADYSWDVQVADPAATAILARQVPLLTESLVPARCVEAAPVQWRLPPADWFALRIPGAFTVGAPWSPRADADGTVPLQPPGENAGVLATFALPVQMVGWPVVEMEAAEGTVVELIVAEAHDPANGPWLDRGFFSWSRFVCAEGLNRLEPFDYESCRWLQLHIHAARGPVRIRSVALRRRSYPWPQRAQVHAAEPALDRLFAAEVNTVANSCQETVVDGMARERQQYSGDCGYQLRVVRWLHGDQALSRRFLRTFSDGLTVEGYFLDTWPAFDRLQRVAYKQVGLAHWGPILDHGLAFLFDCWHTYWETGDLTAVEPAFPRLLRFADYLMAVPRQDGLLPVSDLGLPVVWLDHDAFLQQRHKQCPYNLYVAAAMAHALVPLARAYGEAQRATELAAFAQDVLRATVARFWDEREACFVDNLPWQAAGDPPRYSDYTLGLAVLYDLCPGGETARAIALLRQMPPAVGRSYPANAAWRYRALARAGAVAPIVAELRGVWAQMPSVRDNCTVQEKWHARPDSTDLFSHSAVAPLLVLFAGILGLRALEPGYARFSLTPQLDTVDGLDVEAHLPQGVLAFRSAAAAGTHRVQLHTPARGQGELRLPPGTALDVPLPPLPPLPDGWRRWQLPQDGTCTLTVAGGERGDAHLPEGWHL
jgi:hypothetical protein